MEFAGSRDDKNFNLGVGVGPRLHRFRTIHYIIYRRTSLGNISYWDGNQGGTSSNNHPLNTRFPFEILQK